MNPSNNDYWVHCGVYQFQTPGSEMLMLQRSFDWSALRWRQVIKPGWSPLPQTAPTRRTPITPPPRHPSIDPLNTFKIPSRHLLDTLQRLSLERI